MKTKHITNEEELKERLRKKQVRAIWYQNNREKVREQQKLRLDLIREGAYVSPYDLKKIKRRESAAAAALLVMGEEVVVVDESKTYTLIDIAKLLHITPYRVQTIVMTNKRYKMPNHMYIRLDGSAIYSKELIDDWVEYANSLLAFLGKKGAKIKIGGAALQIVEFMRKNKKVIEYCDALRRAKGEVYA
jgi:hypothetical protein